MRQCKTIEEYSKLEELYNRLETSTLEKINLMTGCLKPCNYKKYTLLGNKQPSSFVSDNFYIALLGVSNDTFVETEVLIYTWTSLVAEFGGALGLFLGFSALSVWDGLEKIVILGSALLLPKKTA